MKIVHVVAGIESTNGAAVVACGFARAQAVAGHDVVVACTRAPEPWCDTSGVRLVVFPRSRLAGFRAACFSWAMLRGLGALCADADLVVTHCQWTFPVWWGARCAGKARLVMVSAGSFDPVRLRHSAWKKRLVGWLDRLALRRASCVVATAPVEEDWVRAFEPSVRHVAVVPPGVEIPPLDELRRSPDRPLRLLYLGRRHPLKGLDLLEEAVRDLAVEVRIESALQGKEKESAFAWCDVLVLPTRSENFGLVVAEALAHARPVIVTRAAPWEGVVAHGCGWWTEVSASALRAAIAEATAASEADLRAMGARGRDWMARDFSWARRAAEFPFAGEEGIPRDGSGNS